LRTTIAMKMNRQKKYAELQRLADAGQVVEFFEMAFNFIDNDPSFIFENDGIDIDYKKLQIESMQNYFLELEDYEKCAKTRDWLNLIKEYKTNPDIISDVNIIE
jgi:hypothetical protein